jgi:hypothetical protein
MDDDTIDKALESLKIQIKKEIIDNYFADRVYLEEEVAILHQEAEAYHQEVDLLRRRFMAFYQALGSETACALIMEVLRLTDWPFYQQYCRLQDGERRELLQGRRRRGFTAWRRFRNLVFDLYEELQQENARLRETYAKIVTHQKLINEDIDKFNLSYDFGLIAAQIEAIEGRGQVISGGMLAPEREELSTRMRLKHPVLKPEDLPPLPELPAFAQIKRRLEAVLARAYRP